MRAHLTEITVRSLKPTDCQEKVWDTSTAGFGVRVNGSSKSWIVMYGPKRRLKTLGRYPDMPLADARREAKRLLLEPPEDELQPMTVAAAVDLFDRTHCEQRHRSLTRSETLRFFTKYYIPAFGSQNVSEITTAKINGILDDLLDRPSEATHAFRAMRVFLNWAVRRQLITNNPLQGVPLPAKDTERDRILTDAEIKALWHTAEGFYGDFWKLLLLTGQRRGQIIGLQWDWLTETTIEFPAQVMKGKKPHTIPLGDDAKALINRQLRKGPCVFPSRWDARKPLVNTNVFKVKHDARAGVIGYVLHDLRRTFASKHGEIGTPLHVIEKTLNHQGSLSGVALIYNRYSYMDEQRQACTAIENHLGSLCSRD